MDINKLIYVGKRLSYHGSDWDGWVKKALKYEQDRICQEEDKEREIAKHNVAVEVLRREMLILGQRAECLNKERNMLERSSTN